MTQHAPGRPAAGNRTAPFSSREIVGVPTRYRRRSMAAVLIGLTALGGTALLPGAAAAVPSTDSHCTDSAGTTTCTYTAADGTVDFMAPAGVSTFSVTASGAGGGTGGGSTSYGRVGGTGGAGTQLTTQVTVGANRTYELLVGERGASGLNGDGTNNTGGPGGGGRGQGGRGADSDFGGGGGGGGGATSISQNNGTSVVLVAGGGAGGGGAGGCCTEIRDGRPAQAAGLTTAGADGADGADAFSPGTFSPGAYNGGAGGGGGGLRGGAAGTSGTGTTDDPGTGGYAGTSTGTGTAGSTGDGSLVITYATPAVTPPATSTGADLTATVDAPDTLAVGQDGEVRVTVTNHGTVAAQSVRTRVSIPSGLRIVEGDATKPTRATLAPGASVTYTYDVVGTKQRPRVPVTATAVSRTKDTDSHDNYDTEYVVVTGLPAPPP